MFFHQVSLECFTAAIMDAFEGDILTSLQSSCFSKLLSVEVLIQLHVASQCVLVDALEFCFATTSSPTQIIFWIQILMVIYLISFHLNSTVFALQAFFIILSALGPEMVFQFSKVRDPLTTFILGAA